MSSSVFTKIIKGELPCHKVYETDQFIAILDHNPNTRGHTLCITKQENDKLFEMPLQDYLDLMAFAYQVAKGIEKAVSCERVAMAVVGLEIPHTHVHLIPVKQMHEVTFQTKTKVSPEEMASIAQAINDNMAK